MGKDESRQSRRATLTLSARRPEGGTCEVLISYERMQAVGRRSMGHAKETAYLVPMVLQSPTAVFEGLRHDEDESREGQGWRCYCGVPDRAYRADGSQRGPYPGQVYLVFVNDQSVAYNWRWEKADPDEPGVPENHALRFRRRLELK